MPPITVVVPVVVVVVVVSVDVGDGGLAGSLGDGVLVDGLSTGSF